MGLVEEAKARAPQLAALAAEDRKLRRLSDASWRHLQEGGFVRALQPRRWGGGEVHFLEFVDAVFEIARASPSAGWVAGVIGVHPWQLALFDEQAQQEMWGADAAQAHSSSYQPTGKAEAVEGGFQLSGRWSFSSGCDHCRSVNLGAIAGMREMESGPVPDFRSFLLHAGQYRIEDNWQVAGLCGTGSKDIVVDGTFVPNHRTQSHLDYGLHLPLPGRKLNDGPLYRLPWSVVFNMALATSVLGAAQGFIDGWIEQTGPRKLGQGMVAADDALTQRRLAEASWQLDVAVTRMRADAVLLWEMALAREPETMQQRAQMRWNMNRGCELVANAIAELFRAASGRTIFLDHPLQSRFQDLQGALGHAYLGTDALARYVGGAALGAGNLEMVM